MRRVERIPRSWDATGGLGAQLAAAASIGHEEFLAQVPTVMGMTTGRFTEPDEVAELIAFLALPPTPLVST